MTEDSQSDQRLVSTTTRVGLDEAEAISSPFTSIESFRTCCTIPSLRKSSAHLSRRYRELGLPAHADTQLRKVVRTDEPIEEFLTRHAQRLLMADGSTARLKPIHERPGEEILRWRWISLSMPTDLILTATGLGHPDRVLLLDSSLRVLEPTAHLHCHATASVPFSYIWKQLGEKVDFRRIQTCPDGILNASEWKAWLRRAFVARRILDYWMRYGFEQLTRLVRTWPEIDSALGDLRCGRIRDYSPMGEASLTAFLRLPRPFLGLSHDQERAPPSSIINPRPALGVDRRSIRFMAHLALHQSSKIDLQIFRQLWVQATRIRVMLFKHIVQDPARTGLDEFDTRFRRLGELENSNKFLECAVATALEVQPELTVESLELRKKPGSISKLKHLHKLSRSVTHTEYPNNCRLSWTLHFIRDAYRMRGLRQQIRNHYVTARNLAAQINSCPELIKSIRGLDVASRELSGPLWAVSAPLQNVRDESVRVCRRYPELRPLRLTVHVGEDFRHLLSGLRAIHEPFWWELMQRGDRIGHALALGWTPEDWISIHPEIVQPRHERMFDLAWMLDFVATNRSEKVSVTTVESARNELQDHLRSWDADYDANEFVTVAKNMGRPWLWQYIDGPHWDHFGVSKKYWRVLWKLLARYDQQDDLVTVRTAGDRKLLEILRDELARLLAKWRTPIEINPSSNLLIGGLPHPLAQPLFFLDPFDRKEDRGLVLTLSADDPISFATSLSDEFAYAWAGLVVSGESPTYAQEWLERAARSARRAAF